MTKQVLIIEDETVLARNVARFLARLGYRVHTATSTFDAAHQLRDLHVDAIVLDINLPDGDGLALLRDIRPRFSDAHVIVISGHLTKEQRRCAGELGVKGVLTKPFSLAELAGLLLKESTNSHRPDDPPLRSRYSLWLTPLKPRGGRQWLVKRPYRCRLHPPIAPSLTRPRRVHRA